MEIIEKCSLCARKCGVRRLETEESDGFCKMPSLPKIARCDLHFYEEPNISGENGSGAVFFSGCVMKCEYCQNYEISRTCTGRTADSKALAEMMKNLVLKGAHNINFVSPAPYVPLIKEALTLYRPPVPVIFNCSGYESTESIKSLEGFVDVYLPDFKYAFDDLAVKYSLAPHYTENAISVIAEMYRQVGNAQNGEDGLIKKGVMIRHLVLPENVENSKKVLWLIKENFSENAFLSLMAQYTPNPIIIHKELSRTLTEEEYEEVCDYMLSLGFQNGFVQELESADKIYTPSWDLTD